MPFKRQGAAGAAPSSVPGGKRFGSGRAASAPSEGLGTGAKVGLGVAGGAAALAGLSKMGGGKVGGALKAANAVRQQLMLTGWAGPKSMLGNLGTGVEQIVEGNGTKALREILSKRTLNDAVQSFKSGSGAVNNPAGSHVVELPKVLSFPGRAMGALDEATQAALRRSGMTAKDAQSATLQAPLTGGIGEVLESPIAQYVHPFRRTPFNGFIEGFRKMKQATEGSAAARRGVAIYGGAGAAHGAMTAEDDRPYSIPFAIAASSRYGLPYGLGALAGRALMDGRTSASGIAGSVLPVSEYGLETAMDPRKIPQQFKPAALTALERLTK